MRHRSPTAIDNFSIDAASRLIWLKSELALLSPSHPDYESEKQAIQGAIEELRALIRHVAEKKKD